MFAGLVIGVIVVKGGGEGEGVSKWGIGKVVKGEKGTAKLGAKTFLRQKNEVCS